MKVDDELICTHSINLISNQCDEKYENMLRKYFDAFVEDSSKKLELDADLVCYLTGLPINVFQNQI